MHLVIEEGLVQVQYSNEADMLPDLQASLLNDLERFARNGHVAVVFQVKSVAAVDHGIPAFWLEVTKRLAPKLCAMAIASPSLVVRTAARGFSVANKLRQVPLAVQAFDDEQAALRWAAAELRKMRDTDGSARR